MKTMQWQKQSRPAQAGFTLIEVLVVVAVLAILASFAYSSYSSQTAKARRTDAQAALLGLAQAMERHKTVTGSYKGAADGGNDTGVPAIFPAKAPLDGAQKFYDLTIHSVSSGSSFVIRAIPIAGTAQASDGYLEYRSTGQRFWDRNNDGSPQSCWQESC